MPSRAHAIIKLKQRGKYQILTYSELIYIWRFNFSQTLLCLIMICKENNIFINEKLADSKDVTWQFKNAIVSIYILAIPLVYMHY